MSEPETPTKSRRDEYVSGLGPIDLDGVPWNLLINLASRPAEEDYNEVRKVAGEAAESVLREFSAEAKARRLEFVVLIAANLGLGQISDAQGVYRRARREGYFHEVGGVVFATPHPPDADSRGDPTSERTEDGTTTYYGHGDSGWEQRTVELSELPWDFLIRLASDPREADYKEARIVAGERAEHILRMLDDDYKASGVSLGRVLGAVLETEGHELWDIYYDARLAGYFYEVGEVAIATSNWPVGESPEADATEW